MDVYEEEKKNVNKYYQLVFGLCFIYTIYGWLIITQLVASYKQLFWFNIHYTQIIYHRRHLHNFDETKIDDC